MKHFKTLCIFSNIYFQKGCNNYMYFQEMVLEFPFNCILSIFYNFNWLTLFFKEDVFESTLL